ncbi:apolipoprotein N-acyltransferase [Leucobacter weissii]|uniref:Apolipoprotein N-acyltransferase n=1 Tax=Leucobacter weissii TaxID=1983706 RepID=A0A939MME7_9MICO|nr:apolipoprotein N-acyltransferase [Leucobacter weissii]
MAPESPGSRPRRLPWWLAFPLALLGGSALDAATPAVAWWPAALIGAVLVMVAVWHQRIGAAAAAGALAGAGFWLPHISWLTLYLGPIPWLALSGVMIAWFALFGALAAVATRGLASGAELCRVRGAGTRRNSAPQAVSPERILGVLLPLAQAVTVAGLWVLREQVQGAWPYGGFAWGRLAHTQAEGPLAELSSWLGFSGLSGVIALACALPVAVGFSRAARDGSRGAARRAALAVGVVAVSFALLSLVPAAELERTGALRVAAVQGNSESGIFDDRENGDVIGDHLLATERLLDGLEASGDRVDVIVWPENSAEFDLPGQPYRLQAVERLSARAGAPIVVGTILRNEDGSYTNSTLVVSAEVTGLDGTGADGLTDARYDKRRPVPFAEYMPNRPFFRALVPDLVDLVQLEYTAGARSAVIDIAPGASGAAPSTVRAGIAICFDIIFDDHAVAMIGDGAEVIFAQTNNADFGRTDESAQQLQIARLRAVETGRALVNISTVGTSAVVLPDGSEADRLPTHTAGAMIAEVPLVRGETPALRLGSGIALAWGLAAVVGVGLGAAGALLARGRRGPDPAGAR